MALQGQRKETSLQSMGTHDKHRGLLGRMTGIGEGVDYKAGAGPIWRLGA